jgi:hypothetical protein
MNALEGLAVGDTVVYCHLHGVLTTERKLAEVTSVTKMHFKATLTGDRKHRLKCGSAVDSGPWARSRYRRPRDGEIEEIGRERSVRAARASIEDALPKCNDPDALEAALAAICGMVPTPEDAK